VWPKVPDQHKPGKPLVPWGLGIIYVLFATVYLFLFYFAGYTDYKALQTTVAVSAPLTLAVCILFGGFMGMLDDWVDLKWRYKAFMPLIAALPLMYFALLNPETVRTSITIPFLGMVQFGDAYIYLIIPIMVMVVTNTINMLGGLNGLETIGPAIILIGLTAISTPEFQMLMIGPLIVWLILAFFNFQGKLFVGNTGSFAIGLTIAAFAVLTDLKSTMLISILPYVFNSIFILATVFFVKKKAGVHFDGKLVTLLTYKRPLTEKQVVTIISIIIAGFTILAVIAALL